jgi:hypothetical protein
MYIIHLYSVAVPQQLIAHHGKLVIYAHHSSLNGPRSLTRLSMCTMARTVFNQYARHVVFAEVCSWHKSNSAEMRNVFTRWAEMVQDAHGDWHFVGQARTRLTATMHSRGCFRTRRKGQASARTLVH